MKNTSCLRRRFSAFRYVTAQHIAALAFCLFGSLSSARALAQASLGTPSTVTTINAYTTPDGNTHTFKIATLTASTDGTFDYLHLAVNLNYGWGSTQNASFDAMFANRGAFAYQYTQRGATLGTQARLVAYQASAGAAVDIYLVFAQYYTSASWTVLENMQEYFYTNPTDTLGVLPPDSTIVFDTGNPSVYPPTMYSNFSGNVGIGNIAPQQQLSVSHSMNVDQADSGSGATPDLSFGSASGEGVASSRVAGSTNPLGLDFYTQFAPRLSITNGGSVGIGTRTPLSALHVNGDIRANSIIFPNGQQMTSPFTAASLVPLYLSGANVGVNIATPQFPLDVAGGMRLNGGAVRFDTNYIDSGGATGIFGNAHGWTRIDPNGGRFLIPVPPERAAVGDNILDIERTDTWQALTKLGADGSANFMGNVGIGTPNATAKLEVNGNIRLSQNTGSSITFSDNSIQSTAWTGVLSGGDYAESVEVRGDIRKFEVGDLLMIDTQHAGGFLKAAQPYSTLISGVYATKPGVVGRRQPKDKPKDDEVPMAMVGIVPTKVSAENGAVHIGDLLVSASTPGYAMKGTDGERLTGAVIGKALGTVESDKRVIEVLISLQ